jgi:Ca2+-binding RTX toxin-like protein
MTSSNLTFIVGTNNDDNIYGDSNNNFIVGMAGDDTIQGGVGNDTLIADDGDDWVNGDHGDRTGWVRDAAGKYVYIGAIDPTGNGFATNSAIGGEYDDIIAYVADANAVTLNLDASSIESVFGGAGNDNFTATTLAVKVFGGAGNDTITTGTGNDNLDGGDGNDSLFGGYGSDYLFGGGGNDYLVGQEGNDILLGGNGNDILVGFGPTDLGRGSINILTGGGGFDRFILGEVGKVYYDDANTATAGVNDYGLITDFSSVEDIIQLCGQASDYSLGASVAGTNGLGIYRNGATTNELIGIIQTADNISLTNTCFSYV